MYDLSVLSNIPQAVADMLPADAPSHRLRPLFTIGVHDIPALMQEQSQRTADDDATLRDDMSGGWIACTTDSILAMKETLWDVLVTMPPTHSSGAAEKAWPTVECPGGQTIKATQRDLRRFRSLKVGLARIAAASKPIDSPGSPLSEFTTQARPSTSGTTVVGEECEDALDKVVQPATWTELAYGGFMWWASAGEQRRGYEHDEAVHDASLIADWAPAMPSGAPPGATRERMVDSVAALSERRGGSAPDGEARVELAIVAFFHRLTTDILTIVSDAVDAAEGQYEDEDEDEDESEGEARLLPRGNGGRPARIDSSAFELMGLDVWSDADGEFVRRVADVYFGRGADVEGKGIEVCGMRVC
ncbi:DUF4484 domain-containing protein [Candidatus Bathyarchaeota archaeon]|nr:DUF4484 domain-containing protein [Candidatus Bathyarchaeota archaeon]